MARATVAQIAAEAGVSTAVVSLVLNGKDNGKFLPETVERVTQTSRRLGYRVDRRALSLTTGRSRLIALIVPDVTNPFFAAVQMGILDALGSEYQLLAVTTSPDDRVGLENAEAAVDLGVDGMLIAARPSVIPTELPIVVMDLPGAGDGHNRVNLDVGGSARELARRMLHLGHRSVVYLEADVHSATLTDRFDQFTATMGGGGAAVELTKCAISIEAAEILAEAESARWLAEGHTAVVCATDLQAYGVFAAFRNAGISIPAQMSLIGGDDLPFSRLLDPPLTSVSLPARELGRVSAERLLQQIKEGGDDDEMVRTLPTSLIVRASLGPASG